MPKISTIPINPKSFSKICKSSPFIFLKKILLQFNFIKINAINQVWRNNAI